MLAVNNFIDYCIENNFIIFNSYTWIVTFMSVWPLKFDFSYGHSESNILLYATVPQSKISDRALVCALTENINL